jgi:amino acid adenylation domain-containing protein
MTSALELSDKRQLLLEKLLRKKGVEPGSRPAIPRRSGSGPAPLSFGQQRLWFLHQLEPAGTAYNLAEAVRLRGRLDAASLQRALTETARRHEVLRTVYAMIDGEPRQIVQPPAPVPLPLIHLSGLPAPRREAEAGRIAADAAARPFDLARGPVLRAALLEIGRDDHVLLLALHHIATDGWSMGLLIRELTLHYAEQNAAQSSGAPSPLPALPLQYSDFAAWQRGWLQGETLDNELRYWQERLTGAPTQLALPVDHPWPAVQSSRGDRTPVALDGDTAAVLRELARERGATLFMVLAGGLAALLQRITGEDDLLLGTPASGRDRPELEGLIGFFINTLVLRADLSGDPGVPALLSRVKETVLGADAHQVLPFERLIDALELPRDLSRSPLFQVMLAFQNLPAVAERPGTLDVQPFPFAVHQSQFELYFSLTDTPGGLFGLLEYRTDLFEAASAWRLARHFEALMTGMARAPQVPVSQLPLLSVAEEQLLVHEWNDTATAFSWPRERGGLHHLVAAQAARTPGAVAVSCAGESLTYAELETRANRLARHLRSLGCGQETRVAVAMERSLELLVALLATLKSGAAYVPLDPDYPRERLDFMLADAKPAVLLLQERLRAGLPETAAQVLPLHSGGRESEGFDGAALDEPADDQQLAYVIYTSGSTGRPKGAMGHHAGIRNRLLWMQDAYRLSAADTVLQKTPDSFDVSVWEFFWPLLAGARVAFALPGEHRDPAALAARIAAEGVTVLHFVPSMLQLFLEEPGIEACRSLRRVVASGEALTPELVRRFHERLPGVALENLYGPTEASVDVTFQPCLPDAQGRTVPIGRPIANTRIHLMHPGGRPVPLGVAGELWIGGANVGRGYLGRPQLTAERFVPESLDFQGGSRAYRTGDLARRRPDGAIEYLGRIDHQVKLRGVRIELGEIESALLGHSGIREAAVVVREDRGMRRLVGYVAPAGIATADELRRFLLARLPEVMVPARFVELDALPLSPNGKLDRRALPAPDSASALADTEHVPPASPLEEILAEVWSQVLDVTPVGVRDNFFALGGDSILSLQVVARMRQRGFDLTLQQVFQHQTVRELAREIAVSRGDAAPARINPFELVSAEDRDRLPGGLADAYPLARLQAGMLFHSALDPGTAVYHDLFSERLRGTFDEAALRRSIAQVLKGHPVLRTSFALTGFQEPLQLIHREIPGVPLTVEDLRRRTAEEQEREVSAWLEAERHRGFDWAQPPLLRFHVHRLGEDVFQHSLSFHHSILDGWSAATLRTELMRVYISSLRGEELPEPLPETGFRDFIALERQALESAATQEMWLRQLEGATATLLPRWPGPRPESPRGHDLFVPVSPETLDGLKRGAREAGVPLKSMLCASHLKVAQLVSGETDVIIGSVVNGRPEQEGADESLGLFLNTLPFRMRLGDESWAGLAQAAFALERDMLPHRRFPLAEIQAARGGRPLFDMVFGVIQFHVYKETRAMGEIQALSSFGYEETNFPLGVNFGLDADGSHLAVRLNFSDAEILPEQVRAIGSYFERALAAIAGDVHAPHAQAVLLSEVERRQVCEDWSRGAPAAPRLHTARLFEDRVRQSPSALAVVAGGARLTYGELDRRASQVARSLRAQGVGPESRVAVCLDRSPALLVALLGVWKAGGAYVPLDPAYPLERLKLMLEDSGAAVLVTAEGPLPGDLQDHIGGLPILRLDANAPLRDAESGDLRGEPGSPESLAYIIYTSGSTGLPKGVLVPHGGLGNLAAAQAAVFDVRPGDRVLQFSPVSFDASVSEILMALLGGAELHLADPPRLMPGPDLVELLTERRITHLTLPPSVLAVVPEAPLPDLRVLVVAGEACPPELVRRWSGGPAGRRVVDAYGPTESTVCATAGDVTVETAGSWQDQDRPRIGRPIAGLRVLVLDRTLAPAATGAPGEILLGGAGLARGYHARPDLTAERFVPDPFRSPAGTPGARLYRTGDLGRWLPDGTLDFLGRIDQQVKIRGFRIEPGEVAAALERHPAVRNAVVATWDAGGDVRLAAWIVPREEAKTEAAALPAQLGGFLRASLPAHLVPSAFVMIDALPLTPSGKLDRIRLPHPDPVRADRSNRYVAPRTATEEQLAGIWAAVLGIERVGLEDNLLELGGHSLLAMQIILRVRSELGVDLPLRTLYGSNTLADMALAVANVQAQSLDADLLAELLAEVEQTPPDQLAAELADE